MTDTPNATADCAAIVINALKKRDINELREISHQCSEEAALGQDERKIQAAIVTYCFNKLLSKVHYRDKVDELTNASIEAATRGDFPKVLALIEEFDRKYSFFEGSLVQKAKVKVASRLYSSGLSIARSAELLGASVSDVLDYVGVTRVHSDVQSMTVAERLKIARSVFK
ncbi:MAG: hypothetical protein PHG85_03590 [Candidatus Altiarchaeota archaeon]|nr:hypothetical protein [Candidatus Altiarchaeota archaeon]